ncbi:MBL fold metallo-hydrolase [Emticicia sp. BO119]|uniref:MBL fold metallo-hydrolase n=1 Tax=Emticicia sp. BO119 TaxID=2757768 RepID=UPI0015F0065C|nr:MBL fold metallo-hydrolase [Emticicia sp. BO119]MBA4851410.1 pyrroloquinoline quinone biosynthesis protein PqqB [Emticicia sp. BO119]
MKIALLLSLFISLNGFAQSPYIVVLGIAQDGGYPQAGCNRECCKAVSDRNILPQWVSCLALIDPQTKQRWIFDATPDFKEQLQLLKKVTKNNSNDIDGIFLTHAHIGHYTGLMNLGREVMGASNVKVYTMPRMKSYLATNGPWSQLVNLRNIDLTGIAENKTIELNEHISIQPFLVPHRDEYSETVGFQIKTAQKSLIYIPDIDKWQKWQESLPQVIRENDFVLIDGTFYKDGEINRPMSEVPHPFVTESIELLKDLPISERNKVYFIHLNHTNPLLRKESAAYKSLTKQGFKVAYQGLRIGM